MVTKRSLKNGPLQGITVVEYGIFHAGPGAGAILGDLGAEIIKIETGSGDPMRRWTSVGPTSIALPNGESVMIQGSNRNKKSIWLDIKKPEGSDILSKLLKKADVFITNLRTSTKQKLGLDYASIARINPKLIHASVSGYGQKGPMSDMGAFDPMGQAKSGMMFLTGKSEPVMIQGAVLDQATSITLSHAILAALYVREHEGFAQAVDTSLFSSALWLLLPNIIMNSYLNIDQLPWERKKNSPLRNCFCCMDGKWIMGVHHPEDKYWPIFCQVTGMSHLIEDKRYFNEESRKIRCSELVHIFDHAFKTKTRSQWMEITKARGLMFSPVQRIKDVLNDIQALANDYIVEFDDPHFGPVKIPGYPQKFSAHSVGTRSAAPAVGEHTYKILRNIGFSIQDIQDLEKKGVVRNLGVDENKK